MYGMNARKLALCDASYVGKVEANTRKMHTCLEL